LKEQNAHWNCLEQVERLQHENLVLLQQISNGLDNPEKLVRQKLDMLPSYDALYSFAVGVIKKLSRLRNLLVEHSREMGRAEVELIHSRTCQLVTLAKAERTRLEKELLTSNNVFPMRIGERRRSCSYHGEGIVDRVVSWEVFKIPMSPISYQIRPSLDHHFPYLLHGRRLRQRAKHSASIDMEILAETNEQDIEVEFLRLFDYAKCILALSPFHGHKPFPCPICFRPLEDMRRQQPVGVQETRLLQGWDRSRCRLQEW